ncbi:hypothetical protein M8J76_011988 [Diaphorina citri]|nr:hypothetical protein M8J75_011766 [Diaphorina citri]KAI5749993.1 hypothetical protein M8J76_011988 [Diaphorina citri]KAI5755789.1 hypothetical protein M8J77_019699 [Diaphorina citri]
MDAYKGKVAIVTGASAGIGAAICKALVREGMIVVGLARREENIQKKAKELEQYPGKLHARKVDLRNEKEILDTFQWIKETFKGGVHVMINNAGLVGNAPLTSGETEKWRNIYEVNVLALNICTREAAQSMFANSIDNGYIININSISGHRVLPIDGHAMYAASKHGVTVISDALRRELVNKKSRIKVTSISPGMTATEIFKAANWPVHDPKTPTLQSEDIAEQVVYLLKTPAHVQITELTIVPVGFQF